MADTFIEAHPCWINERTDKVGKVLSVSAEVRYYKTDGPYTEIDKNGEEYTYYNRTFIETVKYEDKPGAEIVSSVDTKLSAEVAKESLASDKKVFNEPTLQKYRAV